MKRKFMKKAGPFGMPPPSTPPNAPKTPPTGLGGPTPGPTPPAAPESPMGHSGPKPEGNSAHEPSIEEGLKPRMPGEEMAPGGKTDVHLDAASGKLTIEKPGVTIHVAKESAWGENTLDKLPEGEPCTRCGGTGMYLGGDCHDCEGTGIIQDPGGIDPWNYTHAPRDNYLSTERFAKTATHKDWIEFKHNDNEPQYGDWGEPSLARDTHEDPYAAPANRLVPPLYTVKATIPDEMSYNARSIAYTLQTTTMLDVTLNGNTLTIEGVASPISMITELSEYGIDADVVGGGPDSDTNEDYKPGQKVAVVGDYPDMNYYYNPNVPPVTANLIGKTKEGFVLNNNIWGNFKARRDEICSIT